jgi:hypothetical protein
MKIKYFCILVVMMIFNSCEKEYINTKQNINISHNLDLSNIKVSFKNDMLVFESLNDYKKMFELYSVTKDFSKNLKKYFPYFKSIEDAYFEFIESDNFKNLSSHDEIYKYQDFLHIYKEGTETFIDPLLYFEKAKIFNSNGMVQIGNEIIKRKYDEIKSLKISEVNDVNNLFSEFKNNSQVKSESIKVLIKSTEGTSTEEKNKGSLEPRVYSECAMYWCSDPASGSCSSHKYRVIGRIYVETWIGTNGLTNVGAFTKSYKRGLFGIWASSSSDIKLKQSGNITLNLYTEQGGGGGYSADYNYDISKESSFGETSTIERSYQPSGYYLNNATANLIFEGRVRGSGLENPQTCPIIWN